MRPTLAWHIVKEDTMVTNEYAWGSGLITNDQERAQEAQINYVYDSLHRAGILTGELWDGFEFMPDFDFEYEELFPVSPAMLAHYGCAVTKRGDKVATWVSNGAITYAPLVIGDSVRRDERVLRTMQHALATVAIQALSAKVAKVSMIDQYQAWYDMLVTGYYRQKEAKELVSQLLMYTTNATRQYVWQMATKHLKPSLTQVAEAGLLYYFLARDERLTFNQIVMAITEAYDVTVPTVLARLVSAGIAIPPYPTKASIIPDAKELHAQGKTLTQAVRMLSEAFLVSEGYVERTIRTLWHPVTVEERAYACYTELIASGKSRDEAMLETAQALDRRVASVQKYISMERGKRKALGLGVL
jgi:predicted RNase H-like HicB family nuclease